MQICTIILLCGLSMLSNCIRSNAQGSIPDKASVLNAIRQTNKYNVGIDDNAPCISCGEWYANNKDSSFYTKDTLRLYNVSNNLYDSNHSRFYKVWTLGKMNKFSQSGLELCNEPPLITIEFAYNVLVSKERFPKYTPIAPVNYFITQKINGLFLITYAEKKVFERYKIIELKNSQNKKYGNRSFELILVRQKKRIPYKK